MTTYKFEPVVSRETNLKQLIDWEKLGVSGSITAPAAKTIVSAAGFRTWSTFHWIGHGDFLGLSGFGRVLQLGFGFRFLLDLDRSGLWFGCWIWFGFSVGLGFLVFGWMLDLVRFFSWTLDLTILVFGLDLDSDDHFVSIIVRVKNSCEFFNIIERFCSIFKRRYLQE
jgi:hypothetical protein